ncbi:hypothetical protein NDA14_001474 [Ustilago hordei]|uniref:Conserved uncharacterized protein n=1 Tax=Ustilago hordei TaxID=120017 RepID=I2FZK7_USTHO|nr:hypothetical protein NDA10_000924 [Ustilago hordei]KAJ1599089.1 hypothetical protein NDA14_001474 [Ustilago hordei]UTT91458.1 hypothetical protein NDA17_000874 [Ustilago hordei]CCF52350.1 conserved uncharacterized protein [Ustilago hordei]
MMEPDTKDRFEELQRMMERAEDRMEKLISMNRTVTNHFVQRLESLEALIGNNSQTKESTNEESFAPNPAPRPCRTVSFLDQDEQSYSNYKKYASPTGPSLWRATAYRGTQDNGQVKEFLGVKVTHNRMQKKILLDLMAYIQAMAKKWLEKPSDKSWILIQSIATIASGNKCVQKQVKQYQELVSQLLWVSNTAHPDILYTVGTLTHYMSDPTTGTWNGAIHTLKYLNQTSQYQLQMGGKTRKHREQLVVTYTNTKWASDPTNGWQSTLGAITYVYGCPVSWRSQVQKCVALSAVEAEFIMASEATQKVLFFSYMLRDLGIKDVKPLLQMDSQGYIQDNKMAIEHVGTTNNIANILTKPLRGVETS